MVNLADIAEVARHRLDPVHHDFFAGGAGDERTVRANTAAFDRYRLLPRVLRGAAARDLRVTLFGRTASMPVLLAPTAFHRLAHPDGELATARAAAATDTTMIVSMAATRPVEEIAAAAGSAPLWFQVYVQPDRGFTAAIVRRAVEAGCRALVVTVDSAVFGRRERDLRHGFHDLPAGLACENLREPGAARPRDIVMDAALGWDIIGWLRSVTRVPIVLKGILHPADARLAVEHGADGILVSNHGGRQLDGVVATIDALPAIVDAVGGRVPVLLDGGIRRGSDVATALALGATAVAVGRPVVWGLAAGGETGVRETLELLRADLDRVLALCGATRPADLGPDMVLAAPCWCGRGSFAPPPNGRDSHAPSDGRGSFAPPPGERDSHAPFGGPG